MTQAQRCDSDPDARVLAAAAPGRELIADPYGVPGDRMYRTGELGCWRGDGELDHHGRLGSLPIGQLVGYGTATVLNTAGALI
ncbi:hypothetical protein [Nocardia sp. NPDC059239]|uniref:hypothetical protein n=1 Tax=unclassified Nocardia TaxID=2637762 RepID=UPI0036C399F7